MANASTHTPEECTYRCPNTGHEVLAYRDERHVVIPSDEHRALLARMERWRSDARFQEDRVETLTCQVLDLAGDEWDADEAADHIAVQYVRHLEAEVERLQDGIRDYLNYEGGMDEARAALERLQALLDDRTETT